MTAGGRIDIDVVLNDKDVAARLDSTLTKATASAKKAAGALGLAFGGAAVLGGLKSVIDAGVEFDTVLNQLRGVTGATGAEMAAVSEKARQLGNDIAIPATSASDAAQAMLELSKGGLSVQQAMDAARGSLQLAAAAQISAAQASEIQAQAINTFSLKASDAGHVADVLAGTANAAAGEITDIAQGLQQAGSVASQFGMTIDETAGALGVLANNGIKGSDAGTLLKSTLLALQDTGKPAATAMEELGISVYDAQGKFRGLGPIMDELKTASTNLTEEQYNQATATLFGSDAMRLAGIAAKDGSKSFREMTEQVGKAGSAQRLAEEMAKGLPGQLERLQNAADETKLALYDLLRGPLTDLASFGADQLGNLSDLLKGDTGGMSEGLRPLVEDLKSIGDGLHGIAQDLVGPGGALTVIGEGAQATGKLAVAGLEPITGAVGGVLNVFAGLPAPVQTAALAMGAFAIARNKIATPGPLKALTAFRAEMSAQNSLAKLATREVDKYGRAIEGTGRGLTVAQRAQAAYRTSTLESVSAMRGFTDQVGAVRRGAAAAGEPVGLLTATMRTMGERNGALGQIGGAFTAASQGMGRFGSVAGTAAAGAKALRLGAGGLASALGGPWGIALGAASLGLAMYSQRQQEAAQAAAEHKRNVDDLVGSIDVQTGALNKASTAQMAADLRGGKYGKGNTFEYSDQLGISADRVTAAASRQKGALDDLNVTLDATTKKSLESSDYWNKQGSSLRAAGIDADTMTDALRGNASAIKKVEGFMVGSGTTIQDYRRHLNESGQNAVQLGENVNLAAQAVREAGAAQDQQTRAMEKMDPRARTLAEAMEVLGSKTSTAAEKSNALKAALDALGGGAEGFDAAMGQAKQAVEKLPATWQAAADSVGGYGELINSATGRIVLNNDATRALSSEIFNVKNQMNNAATAAYQFAIQNGQGSEAAADAARTAASEIYNSFMKSSDGAKAAGVDVAALATAMGLLPPEQVVQLLAKGGDAVSAELLLIKRLVEGVPPNKAIELHSISDEAKAKLEGIKGLVVTELPDNKGVTVTATTTQAQQDLNALVTKQNELKDKNVTYRATVIVDEAQAQSARWGVETFGVGSQPRAKGGPIDGYAVGGGVGADGAIRGPGTGTSDSILTQVPAGGHVVTAAEVSAAGGHGAVNRQVSALGAGRPGRKTATAGPLMPVALSNGEHYLAPDTVDAAGGHDAIFAWRAGLAQERQGLYLGGLVRAEQVGKANDGLPYITGARDCSMWVSWIVQAAKGQELTRLFTTYSLLDGQTGGLEPGASPSDYLTVGVSQEHMAATVRTDHGPVNTESGGNSSPSQVRWGRGAAGAFDGQFPFRFHLPKNLISPPPDETKPDVSAEEAATETMKAEDETQSRQYIEPPKAPKAEDVAAEAARIGVRGLLETFDMQDSVFADPDKSTIGRALQIGINTQKYREQQAEVPKSESKSGGVSKEDQAAYDRDKLARDQKYENDRLAIKNSMKSGPERDRKLLDLKQKHDQDNLEAKIKLRDKKSGTDSTSESDPSTAGKTSGPADTDPYRLVDSAPYDPSRGAVQWEKEATAALRIAGMNYRWKDKMIGQGDIESHGDPKAVGPDSPDGQPKGWMQVKPGTFSAFRDPKLPDDPFNVLANGVAAAKYANKQYNGEPPWPTTKGYWAGGINAMDPSKAAVVAPQNRRVIGDRAVADEFFIPDTDDPQHIALGAEWARRRGFQLVNMHADGGTLARARGGQAAVMDRPAGPVIQEGDRHYNYSGPADQALAFFRGARQHDNIVRRGAGVQRIGRKGTRP
ncbi:phage tail tape measure protein [Gordonia sihwensis]|uniref:phage tail tape measure protein n=1 Tax=Gordonia sihwensis TaxID=173559 RepID=UPI002417CD49|nr:phage tail tape measure protein [Gordonia sihwensis]WFN93477.1 phage tail tape measure protein [Gordonia sihwensis]